MKWHIIGTLTGKDFRLYSQKPLFIVLAVLGLAVFIAMYFAMQPRWMKTWR